MVTKFLDTPQDIVQPALFDDVFCLHLGGPKRVYRTRDGVRTIHDVPLHAMTVIPKLRAATWRTEGPIEYAHVTLKPRAFDALIEQECGRSRANLEIKDEVGFVNPVLAGLAGEMFRVTASGDRSRLYLDTLFTAFGLALLRHCTDERWAPTLLANDGHAVSGGMAGWRLRRILEYMYAHHTAEIGLDELTTVAGLSRAHFFRAFRQATGIPPGRYLTQLRVATARDAIERRASLSEAAARAGFSSTAAMSHAFRRIMNITPDLYRRWYR